MIYLPLNPPKFVRGSNSKQPTMARHSSKKISAAVPFDFQNIQTRPPLPPYFFSAAKLILRLVRGLADHGIDCVDGSLQFYTLYCAFICFFFPRRIERE